MFVTKETFDASLIAQDDDNDYQESGYVAGVLPDGTAFIASYSHCSCYDTFSSLCGGGISDYFESGDIRVEWQGSPDGLVALAAATADPTMPDRRANEKDYDFDHLMAVYRQILEWDARGRKNGDE